MQYRVSIATEIIGTEIKIPRQSERELNSAGDSIIDEFKRFARKN
jgi:hypothetical protein